MSFRHTLTRSMVASGSSKPLGVVMLNPSVALAIATSDKDDDNTIRSLKRVAQYNGFDSLMVANISPFIATDQEDLITAINSGADVWDQTNNDIALRRLASRCEVVVCAWGAGPLKHRALERRASDVRALLLDAKPLLHCFGRTKFGWPRHPLYLPTTTVLQPFCGRGA